MRNRVNALVGGLLGARVHIGLSNDGIALVRSSAGWRNKNTLLAEQALDCSAIQEPQRLVAQCAALLAEAGNGDYTGLPLEVTLADNWVRLFMVTPPQNAGSLHDLQAAAAMRFQALYGAAPTEWQLQAHWQSDAPFLACALPRNLLAALQQLAAEHSLPLLAVVPQFVANWNRYRRALRGNSWFGVIQDHCLTLGVIAQTPKRQLEAVRSIATPADVDDSRWLQEQIARIALQLNLPIPDQLQLAGNQAQYWTDAAPAVGTLVVRNLTQTGVL